MFSYETLRVSLRIKYGPEQRMEGLKEGYSLWGAGDDDGVHLVHEPCGNEVASFLNADPNEILAAQDAHDCSAESQGVGGA